MVRAAQETFQPHQALAEPMRTPPEIPDPVSRWCSLVAAILLLFHPIVPIPAAGERGNITGPDLESQVEPVQKALPLVNTGRGGFPERLVGAWKVVGIRLDTTFTGRTYYQYDDNRLLGRTITIERTEAKGNLPEKLECVSPTVAEETGKLDDLLRTTMAGQDESGEASVAKRFNLATDGKTTVTAFWIGCKDGEFGPDSPPGPKRVNWILLLPGNSAATRWYDNTILILKRKGK